jgi:hypothetical protein
LLVITPVSSYDSFVRRVLWSAASIALLAGATASVSASSSGPNIAAVTATGIVSRLDLVQIAVGRTTCALGRKTMGVAQGFAVGEHVTIGCLGGVLRRITLAPVKSGPSFSVRTIGVVGAASAATPATLPSPSKGSLSWSSGSAQLGQSPASPATAPVTLNANGAITSLDPTGVTIDGVTCSFFGSTTVNDPARVALLQQLASSAQSIYSMLTQTMHVRVGDIAYVSCTDYGSGSKGTLRLN